MKKITKEELATKLNGVEYRDAIPQDLVDLAAENQLVIVSGYSDDLIQFDGAIYDELVASEFQTVLFDRQGILPEWDSLEKEEEEEVREYFRRVDNVEASQITAIWDKDGYSWVIETDIPHAIFDIIEDGEKFCRGVVFDFNDVGGF